MTKKINYIKIITFIIYFYYMNGNPDILDAPESKYSPTDVLKYMAQMGQDFTRYAQQAEAMLAEAEEKGIPVDLSAIEALQKFKPKGEYEVQLVRLRSELMSIGSDLFSQGVKMTQEDLRERLEKMGL